MFTLPTSQHCRLCDILWPMMTAKCENCGQDNVPRRDAPPDSPEEIKRKMTVVDAEEKKRDIVAEWRFTECLRLVGLDHAQEFAASGIDLHVLERCVRSGATAKQLKDWLL